MRAKFIIASLVIFIFSLFCANIILDKTEEHNIAATSGEKAAVIFRENVGH